MGEAIISRAGFAEEQFPLTATGCTVVITCKTEGGRILGNIPITCKDGSNTVTYNTNETGKTYFITNSGMPNFSAPNLFTDSKPVNLVNVEAQVASIKKYILWYNHVIEDGVITSYTSNQNLKYSPDVNNVDVCCYGGGGGANSATNTTKAHNYTAGGGGGYMNYANNISVESNTNYGLIIGVGGTSYAFHCNYGSNKNSGTAASAGGTSTAFGLSANGGAVGNWRSNKVAIGGSGNGCLFVPSWNSTYIRKNATSSNSWAFNNKELGIIYGGGGSVNSHFQVLDSDYDDVVNSFLNLSKGNPNGAFIFANNSNCQISNAGYAGGGSSMGGYYYNLYWANGGNGIVLVALHYK